MPDPLSAEEIASILERFPGLPEDYLAYLAEVGAGEASSGRHIYGGPTNPREIYGRAVDEPVVLSGTMPWATVWHGI